jgi:CBS domain-containing protein
MKEPGDPGARLTALVAAMIARQKTDKTVADWELATLDENDSMRTGTQRVSQYMQTDIVTVRPDDPIEFVAEIMGWESIRALPVEDERGRLVGLVSYRAVLRKLHAVIKSGGVNADDGTSVGEIMKRTLVTVTPDTPMKDAIKLMLAHKIGSLPVVQGEHIVAMITEQDFVGIASLFLANETQPPPALEADDEET